MNEPKLTAEEAMLYALVYDKAGVMPESAVQSYRLSSVARAPEPHNAPHPGGLNRAQRRARG